VKSLLLAWQIQVALILPPCPPNVCLCLHKVQGVAPLRKSTRSRKKKSNDDDDEDPPPETLATMPTLLKSPPEPLVNMPPRVHGDDDYKDYATMPPRAHGDDYDDYATKSQPTLLP